MGQEALQAHDTAHIAAALEHSITWEDDLWRADPVDVEQVHLKARNKFYDLLEAVQSSDPSASQARILLFHGQSGAGKTHLLRALRTSAHRNGKAYFGYAQMTPDIANYADYYLRRLIHSLEKPYDPDDGGQNGLQRLTQRLVADLGETAGSDLEKLRDAQLGENELGQLVLGLADTVIASERFRDLELDVNIVRALLYLERHDPRVDQRIRQYLHGRQLTPLAHQSVCALDPNTGEDRAFEIITAFGQLMWTIDRTALVFSIDQVEDLRFFDDAEERFQRAVRDLIQIANRLPNAIIIISCLEDFYGQVRDVLAQSYVDRIEKSGPVALIESRTADEAKLIIAKRLEHDAKSRGGDLNYPDPSQFFGPEFFEEFSGLSARRLLEHAQNRLNDKTDRDDSEDEDETAAQSWTTTLASVLGGAIPPAVKSQREAQGSKPNFDYRDAWQRFQNESEAEIPSDDGEMMDTLVSALNLAQEEWSKKISLDVTRLEIADDLPVIDISVRHTTGLHNDVRVFLCNRPTQGGGLKRQLDKVLKAMSGRTCVMLRASDFPPNRKNQTAQAFRKFRDNGGRQILVPIPEWERMMMVREFHAHHRHDPGFDNWFSDSKLLSNLITVFQLMRLDLLGRTLPRTVTGNANADEPTLDFNCTSDGSHLSVVEAEAEDANDAVPTEMLTDDEEALEALPLSVLLGEDDQRDSIYVGRIQGPTPKPVKLNKDVLKRHSAVLGGSGSGKTTLALTMIEQLLLNKIPVVLIDRKGDLCSYANPDVWRDVDDDFAERRGVREKLADEIDVAVYTPGRASGRPISITLLPNGINELPDHEQQLLANLSAAALGEMLHLKNSATNQKQSGTLSVALRILGARYSREVTLTDLITLLEDEDPELTDITQRMDPSGKIRRDLVGQLDSLRHRNSALFEGGGEPLNMDSLLGNGPNARDGRTRLSVIYTGFLGDNENILFWVSQFLSEALRFCQRNPNDELQAVVMFDEADLYIPSNAKPATAEPLQSLLKRARSAGLGVMLATQSPGDLDYKSRDQITSWFIGRVREDTALRKLKAAFQSESGLDPAAVLPSQTVGEFHLVQEGLVRPIKAQRSLIQAEQVPFDRIEQLARETKGSEDRQLKLFDRKN